MKKFFLILCITWVNSMYAQQFKTELSSKGDIENDVVDFHKYGKYLYSSKTNWGKMQMAFTASLKKVKYGVELTQYDEQLKEIKKLSLDNGEKDFGPFHPLVHFGKSSIYVMYFRFSNDDKVKMFVARVNPDDLTVTATKEIFEYDQKNQGFWGSVKTIDDAQIFYTVSEDGNNAWVVHASPKQIVSSVIDADLNIKKTESIPVKLDKLLVTAAHIDNGGNKVLAYRYDNKADKEFYARGLYIQSAGSEGSFTDIKLPDGHFPGNLHLQQSDNGKKLYLGGEYYGADFADGGKGVMLSEVNMATRSLSVPAFYPYTDAIRQRVLDLDFASKKKGQIIFTDHHLNYRIEETDKGTIVMSADMMTATSTTRATFYFTGPIIHVFIKPDGTAAMSLIPKKQTATPFTTFFTFAHKDKLICIYADLPKYHEKDYSDKDFSLARTVNGMVPVANTYDSDGKLLSRKLLMSSDKDMKGNVMISNRSWISDKKILFPVGESKVNMVKFYTSVNQMWFVEVD